MYNNRLCLYVGITAALLFSLSCQKSSTPPVIPPTPIVDVKPVTVNLGKATGFAFTAQQEVTSAQAQIVKAKIHLQETEALIDDMKRNKSRYTEQIANLKGIFVDHINIIEKHLYKTGSVLREQIKALKQAQQDLAIATERVRALEGERDALRSSNTILSDDLKKAEVYKEKYHALTKYKWIVWGLGGWILVKFLGGLGAWSPQGRIAKALIG